MLDQEVDIFVLWDGAKWRQVALRIENEDVGYQVLSDRADLRATGFGVRHKAPLLKCCSRFDSHAIPGVLLKYPQTVAKRYDDPAGRGPAKELAHLPEQSIPTKQL